jgi:nucleotide-binding universal stress UspA family protein
MSYRTIVAAVDQTPAGVHALRAAADLAEAAGARLVALSIVSDPWSHLKPQEVETLRGPRGPAPSDVAEARCLADLRQLIDTTIGTGRAEARVRFGIPAIEVARSAQLEEADLIVLGRQPLGAFEKRPAGLVLRETLQRASVPCLIAPFGQRSWRRALAVVEAAPGDAAVLAAAKTLAALWQEEPAIVRVAAVGARSMAPIPAGAAGAIAALPEVVQADPVAEALKTARRESMDVLVLAHARGSADTPLPFMVERLVERAPCAVLTVPV